METIRTSVQWVVEKGVLSIVDVRP
jgi:hypothetical protein